ncbi:MAG: hypothetical protein ACREQI_14310 [Candidatus Binataceae bacterium]
MIDRLSERLAREDCERRLRDQLERLLLEGIASGEPFQAGRSYWQAKRRSLAAAASRRAT